MKDRDIVFMILFAGISMFFVGFGTAFTLEKDRWETSIKEGKVSISTNIVTNITVNVEN